jgi:hypothetical protein
MLYSVPLKIKDKEYTLKIGMKQVIAMQKAGIDFYAEDRDAETTFKVLHMCIKDVDVTLDELIELFDESDMNMEELNEVFYNAVQLGINKGKEPKKK